MGGFLVFLFIVFCVYMAYKTNKAKKQDKSVPTQGIPTPPKSPGQHTVVNITPPQPTMDASRATTQVKTLEQELQEEQDYHDKIRSAVSARTGVALSSSATPKPNEVLPEIGSIQHALYEMERKQAEEQQAELERRTAAERELARSESARQALKAMNDKKKAESRTPHPGSLINSWDDEDEWGDDYSDREQCEIHYTDSDGNFSIRDVEPLNVRKNGNGNTILVAVDTDIDELRYFRLDRIELVSYDGRDYTEAREISRILRKLSPECN